MTTVSGGFASLSATSLDSTDVLASKTIEVGVHPNAQLFGLTFNIDTIIASLIAAVVVIGLAFFVRAKITAGVPNGVQLFFETVTTQMRDQIEGSIGLRIAPFALPLAVTLFVFILVSNWVSILPVQYGSGELFKPPASDVNFVYALALFVFLFYHAAGARRRGLLTHIKQLVKGHAAGLAPINVIEEIAKPISLSLRLFGNMFAGTVMVALIAMFPWYVMWAPNAIWKLFDLFVGLIQAFIFSLLTILYFSQSMSLEDEHH
jgi:F-type H+-transporting ATPase subunit a